MIQIQTPDEEATNYNTPPGVLYATIDLLYATTGLFYATMDFFYATTDLLYATSLPVDEQVSQFRTFQLTPEWQFLLHSVHLF